MQIHLKAALLLVMYKGMEMCHSVAPLHEN